MFDYDSWVVNFDARLDDAAYYQHGIELAHTAAKYEYDQGNDHDAIREILLALYNTWNFAYELVPWTPKWNGLWRIANLVEGIRDDFTELCDGDPYELTLSEMLGAYIAAPEIDRRSHRYLLDAFKASMYDKPFDLSYHTEWVQRFKSWE